MTNLLAKIDKEFPTNVTHNREKDYHSEEGSKICNKEATACRKIYEQ